MPKTQQEIIAEVIGPIAKGTCGLRMVSESELKDMKKQMIKETTEVKIINLKGKTLKEKLNYLPGNTKKIVVEEYKRLVSPVISEKSDTVSVGQAHQNFAESLNKKAGLFKSELEKAVLEAVVFDSKAKAEKYALPVKNLLIPVALEAFETGKLPIIEALRVSSITYEIYGDKEKLHKCKAAMESQYKWSSVGLKPRGFKKSSINEAAAVADDETTLSKTVAWYYWYLPQLKEQIMAATGDAKKRMVLIYNSLRNTAMEKAKEFAGLFKADKKESKA